MKLEGEALEDFIKGYVNTFNERLTPEAANELHARLLDLYERIRRVPEEWHAKQPEASNDPNDAPV
jgi:hypothetical protein